MRIGVMQPYFFPYIGYFQLINTVARFILFDDVQYIRHGWINRNRILKPAEGNQYILAPLADHKRDTEIKNIKVKAGYDWKEKIIRQTEHYKKRSPFYNQVQELLVKCFEIEETNITKLNGHILSVICDYIGIPYKVEISSEMNFDYSGVSDAGEWALAVSDQLKAEEYINPSGGIELFDPAKFVEKNIKLTFIHPKITEYSQRRGVFEPGMSILDILMFNSPDAVTDMLQNFKLS